MSVNEQAVSPTTPLSAAEPELLERRSATNQLRFALAETAAGAGVLAMLVGEAGSGKTRQAHDLLPFVRQRGGMLIESRIESLNWSNPLDSLLLGLSQLALPLCKQMIDPGLTGQEALLEMARRLGLIDSVSALDLTQALSVQLLVGELCSLAASQLRPLVWIIDDVDLLDPDAMAILDYLIEHRSIPYLMLLMCVRDERAPMIQRWQAQAHCQVFRLEPFSVRDTVSWLIEEQHLSPRLAAGIAPYLQQTCQGNLQLSRFMLDSLAAHDLLKPVAETQWPQRIQQIALQLRTPEAESYFRSQLLSLPETGLELLQCASLIGMEFDARLLHDYLLDVAVQEHLQLAQEHGLIEVVSGDIWRFVHPHLQRLAHQSIEHSSESELHSRLAQRMMKFPNLTLPALHHAQLAGSVFSSAECVKFAHHALQAAQQGIEQGSPYHAGQILEQVLQLLGDSIWLEHAALSEQIVQAWCETLQEPAQQQSISALLRRLPAQASRRVIYLLAACQLRLALLGNDYANAFAAAEIALQYLGEPMAMQPSARQTALYLFKWWLLRLRSKPNLPPCHDVRINSVQEVLADLFGPCFFSRPDLLPAVTLKQLILTLRYGPSPASSGAKICGALILSSLGRYQAAFELAHEAQALSQTVLSDRQRHRVPILDFGFIQPWRHNMQQLLPNVWRWQQNAQIQGDFEFAGYAHLFYLGHSILSGSPLAHLAKEAVKIDEDLRHTRQMHLLPMSAEFRQFLHNLVQGTQAPWLNQGRYFDANMLAQLHEHNDGLNLFNYYLCGVYAATFCHASDEALQLIEQAQPYVGSVRGSVIAGLFRYLTALNRCMSIDRHRWTHRLAMRRDIAQLKQWAQMNPVLFASKSALLQAQWASVQQLPEQAQRFYLEAIESARAQQQHNEYGMAALYYARFLIGRQQYHHARQMLNIAIEQYDLWGASALVKYIQREYGALINKKTKGI
ncbi:AAA family ATPase [Chitinibacter bivalviorum]|uniref:AAA family ATPase n=1 Tax=Chitinibacter bivalviorum TaxID=2739434 RepID=A0A7H9BJB6_9NEIS|nr:AAA family ATPase [Chitinibacter bivalviorum]QLG88755.1 AAA family ATPase [Chitinibacter bivalviorum]